MDVTPEEDEEEEEAPMAEAAARRPHKDPAARPGQPDFTIITGLSGAGRSEAAKSLEDLGYFVVDNLPPALIGKMAELVTGEVAAVPGRVAIVIDVRGGVFFTELSKALSELRGLRVPYRIVFLEASDEALVNRFEATRRRHPLAPANRVVEGIRKERLMMESLRGDADLIIDTTGLTPHQLRYRMREAFARGRVEEGMRVSIISFGYKFGTPRDADMVLDVRFLPNPHWVDELRPMQGTRKRVRSFVTGQRDYRPFMDRLEGLLDFLVPGYVAEGKSYLALAIGCTGGRHRSVVVAEELARYLREKGLAVGLEHRDIERE